MSKETYGGEVEYLVVNPITKSLKPINETTLTNASQFFGNERDLRGNMPDFGYDSSLHLGEIGIGVMPDLISNFNRVKSAVTAQQKALNSQGLTMVDISAYPFVVESDRQEIYARNVLPKPIYGLMRGDGSQDGIAARCYSNLSGRNWRHYLGTDKASLQPWNSLSVVDAHKSIVAINITGFMFNLLGANSPQNGYRDSRIQMWDPDEGIRSTSLVVTDKNLVDSPDNLVDSEGNVNGLTSYYKYVLSNQVPMVIPARSSNGDYKSTFAAVINEDMSTLEILKKSGRKGNDVYGEDPNKFYGSNGEELSEKDRSIKAIDIETGKEIAIIPIVGDFVNGFDFLNSPRFSGRLRIFLSSPEKIDPYEFATVIENGGDIRFTELLRIGGIDEGAICIEGRVSATNLPTEVNPSWARTAIPFVLQTGIIRSADKILQLFREKCLDYNTLSRDFPKRTNRINGVDRGFNSIINGQTASELALEIWSIARQSLIPDELELIEGLHGNEIENILLNKCGPAEEKIEYIEANGGLQNCLMDYIGRNLVKIPV